MPVFGTLHSLSERDAGDTSEKRECEEDVRRWGKTVRDRTVVEYVLTLCSSQRNYRQMHVIFNIFFKSGVTNITVKESGVMSNHLFRENLFK